MAQKLLGPLLEPLGLVALVLVFVGFILLQKDDLRDRFVRLAGSRDMQRTTVALDEAATRLSRYLFLQTAINACFGIIIGSGPVADRHSQCRPVGPDRPCCSALCLMSACRWPFCFPSVLALAVDPGWSMLVWVMALYRRRRSRSSAR